MTLSWFSATYEYCMSDSCEDRGLLGRRAQHHPPWHFPVCVYCVVHIVLHGTVVACGWRGRPRQGAAAGWGEEEEVEEQEE